MQTYTALEHRPGDTPQGYDLDDGLITQNAFGKVIRLDASQQVTSLTPVPIEAEERYAFRAVFRRAVNSPDPSDDAIACGIDWLAADMRVDRNSASASDPSETTTKRGTTPLGTHLQQAQSTRGNKM